MSNIFPPNKKKMEKKKKLWPPDWPPAEQETRLFLVSSLRVWLGGLGLSWERLSGAKGAGIRSEPRAKNCKAKG